MNTPHSNPTVAESLHPDTIRLNHLLDKDHAELSPSSDGWSVESISFIYDSQDGRSRSENLRDAIDRSIAAEYSALMKKAAPATLTPGIPFPENCEFQHSSSTAAKIDSMQRRRQIERKLNRISWLGWVGVAIVLAAILNAPKLTHAF